jgi:hypothetical protein
MKASSRSVTHSCIALTLIALFFCMSLPGQTRSAQTTSAQAQITTGLHATPAAPQPLITQPIDESQLTVLKGNTHPLARPEFDLGTAPATLPMNRMLLVLKRSAQQESALRKLLDDQQDKSSSSYHKWLTPEDYGKQFGPSDTDIQTITAWLQSHGFQVGSVAKGRNIIEFSGSASQVWETFHTTIHKYIVNGEQHWANSSDPQIPSALTQAVAGIHTLHNFIKRPALRFSGEKIAAKYVPGKQPQVTFSDGTHALGPTDYATIYNINPLYTSSPPINGGGINLAVVGRSRLFNVEEDVSDFGNVFGRQQPYVTTYVNGPDPGDLGGGEEAEATLDTTWSGAIAESANVIFVVSATTNTTDGVDLSEYYIIDRNFATIMTESFSTCEANVTSAEAQGVSTLAQQAAAQGLTYIVSSDDSGAEGCDNPGAETVATGPISVNLLASSPYTVAVGGTVFNENGQDSKYWKASNGFIAESAISYIPEDVWNESCTAAQCGQNANIAAGGGGASTLFSKPSWQAGVSGIPNDNARDLPDVSLTAASHDPYLICWEGSCVPDSQGQIFLYFVAGTSASAPSFAGVMALVDQKMEQMSGTSLGAAQGQADYVLYKLAATETLSQCNASTTAVAPASNCIFNDITSGNNAVPGELNYGTSLAQYQSGVGYDLATGLGSVNVTNLVNNWDTVTFNATTTTIVNISPSTITHGQAANVDITVTSTSGTPTGSVALSVIDQEGSPQEVGIFPLTGGSFNGQISSFPASDFGIGFVQAEYGGDGTFARSVSSWWSGFTVNPETSSTTLTGETLAFSGNLLGLVPLGTSISYGNMVYLRADVAGLSKIGVPRGNVTFINANGGLPIPNNPYLLNSAGTTVTPTGLFALPAGPYSVTASYGADTSFNASNSSPLAFTITPASTATTVATSSISGATVTLTANITTGTSTLPSFGAAPSGTVSFFSNGSIIGSIQPLAGIAGVGNLLSGALIPSSATAALPLTVLPTGSNSITATYTGDSNYAPSTSPAITVVVQPDFSLPIGGLGTVTISSPGGSGNVSLTIMPGLAFNSAVTFTCVATSLPAEAQCGQATIPAGQTSGTMSVTTAGPHGILQLRHQQYYFAWLLAIGGIPVAGLLILVSPGKQRAVPLTFILLMLVLFIPACGGGNGGSSGNHDPGTPVGTSVVSVTATSGSLSHTTTFTLTVQ